MTISVIMCSQDAAKYRPAIANWKRILGDHVDVVAVHARSMCEGYKHGMFEARGDILIFTHDDVEPLCDDFAERLKRHFEHNDVVGVAGTNKLVGPSWIHAGPPHIFGQVAHTHPQGVNVCMYGPAYGGVGELKSVRALDGLFIACTRDVAEDVGWDAETFDGWHHYDLDFTFRAFLNGNSIAVVNDLPLLHQSGGKFDSEWARYGLKFINKHEIQIKQQRPFGFAWTLAKDTAEALAIMEAR